MATEICVACMRPKGKIEEDLRRNIFYGYLSPKGDLLVSTIRGKSGDSESALEKTCSWRYEFPDKQKEYKLVKVRVEVLGNE